ncbi:hypothetical protein FQZ97_910060 [compost metagenome]
MGEEIAGNPGGHAHREIAPGRLAHGILKVGAEGVVVADEAAPVAPVARHQRLAPAVEQVEHGGAGGGVQLFQALIEFFAQQAIARRMQQRLDIAVQRQHLGHRAEALDQGMDRLGIELQLATRLDAALLPGVLLGITPGQPDAGEQAEEDQQHDQDDAKTRKQSRHARLDSTQFRHGKAKRGPHKGLCRRRSRL